MRPSFHSCECILFPQTPFFLSCGAFFSIPNPSSFCKKLPKLGQAHLSFCVRNELVENSGSPFLPKKKQESEEVGFLSKPPSRPLNNENKSNPEDEVLEDFLKLFKKRDTENETVETVEEETHKEKEKEKVIVECYEPKPGDFVMGMVVSGNENKLDVNVGADMLGTMLTKEVLPLYEKEMDFLLCDVGKDSHEFMANGKMGILNNDEAFSGESMRGRPVVEPGTVVYAQVLGRTLSGRPLLSTRRFFKRLAWHRVRQIKQLNQPLRVKITEWNTGGLLTRIEGLRAFIPKIELMNKVNNYPDLKENVGRWLRVLITRMNEDTNELILSEKEAWGMLHLVPGSLLDGTVKNIFPYGAQIRIGDTNRSGLLHISKITQERIASVSDILAVNEKVKVMVIPSNFPDKISLSIADLESEPGLFLSDKEKVYAEAVTMAKKYKLKVWAASGTKTTEPLSSDVLHFVDEDNFFANQKWFEFEGDNEPNADLSGLRPFYPGP